MELYRLIVDTESEDTNLIQETILRADHKWKDSCGFTMLHWAASLNRTDVACLLLEKGYSPIELDNNGETPVQLARAKGHDAIAGLIEHYRSGGPALGIENQFYKRMDNDLMLQFSTWPMPDTLEEAVTMMMGIPGVEQAVRSARAHFWKHLRPEAAEGSTFAAVANADDSGGDDADDDEEFEGEFSFSMKENLLNPDGLDEDKACAISVFTCKCVRSTINAGFSNENGVKFLSFARLLNSALLAIPPLQGVLYCAISQPPSFGQFRAGMTFTWASFVLSSMYGNSVEQYLQEAQLEKRCSTLIQINACSARPIKPYSALHERYVDYPFELDMVLPFGSKFRVENVVNINVYVVLVALTEIPSDTRAKDSFDMVGDTMRDKWGGARGRLNPHSTESILVEENEGKRVKNKPRISADQFHDVHHQDYEHFFSSSGSDVTDFNSDADWTLDWDGPLSYTPKVSRYNPRALTAKFKHAGTTLLAANSLQAELEPAVQETPKAVLFLMNYMAEKYKRNKKAAKKLKKKAAKLAKKRAKQKKRAERQQRNDAKVAKYEEAIRLQNIIVERDRFQKEREQTRKKQLKRNKK